MADNRLTRRSFVGGLCSVAGAVPLVSVCSSHVFAQSRISGYPFTLGIASGDPAPDGFVIWTRLAPEPFDGGGMGSAPVEVRYEVAEDDGFRSIVRKGSERALADNAHSVHCEIEGLKPARDYFYRFFADGVASPTGRARTFPAVDADVESVRFATAGCQRWEHGLYTAFRHLAAEAPDFVYHYGDYIYEYAQVKAPPVKGPVIVRKMPRDVGRATRLNDYRTRYAIYKSDPDLQAAHIAAPFIPTFDDHEVVNNWGGAFSSNMMTPTPDPRFPAQRAAAFRAWYEHMPVRRLQRPNASSILAHRRLTLGRLATLHVLDTRQYRTGQRCEDRSVCNTARDAGLSIMGAAQERWLYDGLRSDPARWNVLAQQVLMMQFNHAKTPDILEIDTDKWDAYAANRQRLLDVAAAARLPGLVTLTGDVHSNWAGDLKSDFGNEASATVGVEFVATSISSSGDGTRSENASKRVRAVNPHVKFHNRQRGYVIHTVTRPLWLADFRVVDKVSVPGSPVSTRQSLVTQFGRPGIENA